MLPQLVAALKLINAIWITQDFTQSTVDLCIGDKPLIYIGTMNSSFLQALAFNAQATGENLTGIPVSMLARQLNFQTVSQAMKRGHAGHAVDDATFRPHLMALLDETPLPVVVKAVAEAATPDVPAKKIMKNLSQWAKQWKVCRTVW